MGLRRLAFLLSWAFVLAACGDSSSVHYKDAGTGSDGMGSNVSDARVDAPPDGTPDAGCPGTQVMCNGACVDTNTAHNNCGACGIVCGANETCTGGICCASGEINCNNTCVNPSSDEAHCGNCTTACGANEQCTNGACAACGSGETLCNGACSNPNTDNNNCGTCGHACAGNESCSSGVCCPSGQTSCGGTCVDLTTAHDHCGLCTTACATNQVCSNSACTLTCTAPEVLCNGACSNPNTDFNNCGTCGHACASGESCQSGICCAAGTSYCTATGTCVNFTNDHDHCGNCNTACSATETCIAGACQPVCPVGQTLCNGACVDLTNNQNNCGMCGNACTNGATCDQGVCCAPGTVNCGGQCVATNTNTHCGSCTGCLAGTTCVSQTGSPSVCCASGQVDCNGVCKDTKTDTANCGACGTTCNGTCTNGTCCAPGTTYDNGICCPTGTQNTMGICCAPGQANCNGVCVNEQTDNAHCGSCTNACSTGMFCSAGTCMNQCLAPNTLCPDNTCTDVTSDPNHCGASCTQCAFGASCNAGACACPTTSPDICNGQCTNTKTDASNCGSCNSFCGSGQHCDNGTCCGFGLTSCNGTCLDLQNDNNNCGGCGNVCGNGSTCSNGTCMCGFGQTDCDPGPGTSCQTTSVDPNNCGACGNVCGTGANAGKPYCVSNGCVATCPSPLVACGGKCVNPLDDNANCGACGAACTGQTACDDGACAPSVATNPPPSKCVGGGPPIVVPTGGSQTCVGNLGAVSFTFGLCSCTDIGPLSRAVTTDAFNSILGPYKTSCVTDSDCASPGKCSVSGTSCTANSACTTSFALAAGPTGATEVQRLATFTTSAANTLKAGDLVIVSGVGVAGYNGTWTVNSVNSTTQFTAVVATAGLAASGGGTVSEACQFPIKCTLGVCSGGGVGVDGTVQDSATMSIGGDMWVGGPNGMSTKGDLVVRQELHNAKQLVYSHTASIFGKAFVGGPWGTQGNSSMSISGVLTTPSCTNLPASLTYGACVPAAVTVPTPCDCTAADLVPVRQITQYFADPSHNDNAALGLAYSVFDNPATALRVDLPCGYYYFNSINAAKPITIVVHGHTGVFIGGSMRVSQGLVFDLDPTATLDVFVGGVLNVSSDTTLGSPAYPRLSRMYFGSGSCTGGGGTCSVAADCCSGTCSAGTCVGGGGNLSQAISLSNSGHFNGLLWAGYGQFTHSNPLEMYGSIFTQYFDASGDTTIHYDNGAVQAGTECPPPSGACESCRDCVNQACVNNQCGACTADSQCCPPLKCINGGCSL